MSPIQHSTIRDCPLHHPPRHDVTAAGKNTHAGEGGRCQDDSARWTTKSKDAAEESRQDSTNEDSTPMGQKHMKQGGTGAKGRSNRVSFLSTISLVFDQVRALFSHGVSRSMSCLALVILTALVLLRAVPTEQFGSSLAYSRGGAGPSTSLDVGIERLREVVHSTSLSPHHHVRRIGAMGTALRLQEGTQVELAAPVGIDDLIERGIVRVWRRSSAPPEALSGGARGAGHNASSSKMHREPEEIYVIGTSHVSEQSATDVERVVRAVRPDNVVVELCRSRAGIMYADASQADAQPSMLSLNGESFLKAFGRSLSLGGGTAFLLRALLARSPALNEVVGVVGRDFRAARVSGEDCGAQVVLGDRPVEITLERSWRAMTGKEKVWAAKLLAGALLGGGNTTELREQTRGMEATGALCKQAVDSYEAQLAEMFPSVIEPLIRERDVFLSLTMKGSMAVNGCKTVVGVVGAGHLDGVMKCLDQNHSGKFKELTWTPSRAAIKDKVFGVPRAVFKRLAFDTVIFGGAYVIYELWQRAQSSSPP